MHRIVRREVFSESPFLREVRAPDVAMAVEPGRLAMRPFAEGGDIVTGGATVILAMGSGRRAARAIAPHARRQPRRWPVTFEDLEAFGAPNSLAAVAPN